MSRTTENKKKLRARSYEAAQTRKSARKTDHADNFARAQRERKLNESLGCGSITNSQLKQRAKYYTRLIAEHGEGHFKNASRVHAILQVARTQAILDGDDA